ncbi:MULTISPECIES: class I SAM-dependent methyltransferase [Flavobacteriaceae]|uniref:class I SAM-dependent methyltransferase n=1 Tax=Flavobacteriaceae TaxID=49546 RepID=UPI001492E0D3|nr:MULTISPECIES: class I SAM-dependent methyltransferase [Allomuricauda]MDC6365794.1 class I SAM-dependent methyltransferase [Muricauda sp. AC10]
MKNLASKAKKPWPTKAAMSQIYEQGLWGKNTSLFYSGSGSHNSELVEPYVKAVQSFLKSFESPISVADLGCGDFNVGRQLMTYAEKYIAVDIVKELIDFNQNSFQLPNLEFQCLDIATDPLPNADCAILRQVLQHLSNTEVKKIVDKLYKYQYVILTEHLPLGDFVPNRDIVSGQGTRLKKKSGVDVHAAPFNFKIEREQQLLSLADAKHGGLLETTLYKVF